MKIYKIKHLETGLYYIPSRRVKVGSDRNTTYSKSNLSKKGKIYSSYPSLAWCERIYSHTPLIGGISGDCSYNRPYVSLKKTTPEEWEVVTIEIDPYKT